MQVEDIILLHSIGKGSFGEVFLTNRQGEPGKLYATKKVAKSLVSTEKVKKYFNNEIFILRNLNHPNIIRFHETKETLNNYYLVFEFCNGGGLTNCMEKYKKKYGTALPEEVVQHLMRQTVSGLQYLHNNKILHRDIKCDNIMVHYPTEEDNKNVNLLSAQVKIIDFGFARYLEEDTLAKSVLGSPINMDPQILHKMRQIENNNQSYGYDQKADIWSLGTVCYELLVGVPPFDATSYNDLLKKIQEGNYKISRSLRLSKQCISFLKGMLQHDPKKRLDINDLARHKFIVNEYRTFEVLELQKREEKDIILNTKEDTFSVLGSVFAHSGEDIEKMDIGDGVDRTIKEKKEGMGIICGQQPQEDILGGVDRGVSKMNIAHEEGNSGGRGKGEHVQIDDNMKKTLNDMFDQINRDSLYIEPMLMPIIPKSDETLLKLEV